MKTKFSNGTIFVDTGAIAMRLACAFGRMPGDITGERYREKELDASYCIDAPMHMPAGSMYAAGGCAVWERTTFREGA